ncbi:MAG: PH domain-containing protein [Candidatus Nomurabacteria bacterium]|jgi:uncharacterized membrane protein YdbT with pleckstrin-like domain|nr:PH domain-containing protein [Candidatus Nomurabacteria bacterium]
MEKSFDGQRDGEEVVCVLRRHPLAMRKGLYGMLIVIVIGALPMFIFPSNVNLFWVFIASILLGGLVLFYHWISWYFTMFIITNERVRLVSQKGLFGKSVIELPLDKVQNLSYKIAGVNGELFKYGTIVLQTMVGDLVMDRLYRPEDVFNTIQNVLHERRNENEEQDD